MRIATKMVATAGGTTVTAQSWGTCVSNSRAEAIGAVEFATGKDMLTETGWLLVRSEVLQHGKQSRRAVSRTIVCRP